MVVASAPPKILDCSKQLNKDRITVAYASDLHLDFGDINPEFFEPPADILILAGDIVEARRAHKQMKFWKGCSENFAHVLYIPGNHEYYSGSFPDAEIKLKNVLVEFDNIHVLQNEARIYNNVVFLGSTLWTDIGKKDPIGIVHARMLMAEYNCVRESKNGYKKLSPDTTIAEHFKALEWIKQELKKRQDKNCVIFTHHAPTHLSIHPDYVNDKYGNMNYYSDLSELILNNPNLKHWVHGHVHNLFNYGVRQCDIHANPRGYPGERPSYLPPYRPMIFGI